MSLQRRRIRRRSSLGDSRIEHVRAIVKHVKVRVEVLEYSQLHKKAYNLVVCEF